jgi:acyl-CoA thioester hydrolase
MDEARRVRDDAFRYRFRVRYHECDAQGIVFNARWGEYVDVACTELCRAVLGAVDAADWRLVKQTLAWRAPGRFDDVIDARVETVRVGTTSFVLATEFRRVADGARLADAETVYVVVDRATGGKQPVTATHRTALLAGAPGRTVDASGARSPIAPAG